MAKKRRRKRRSLSRPFFILFVLIFALSVTLVLNGNFKISSLFGGSSALPSITDFTIPSGVMKEVNPDTLRKVYGDDWKLLYIGSGHPLSAGYKVTYAAVGDFSVDKRIAPELREMLSSAKKAGYDITIAGAYRSPERSQELYDSKVKELKAQGFDEETAKVKASGYVALPYYSEHNAAISVDLNFPELTSTINYTDLPSYQWMLEHCADYGFIPRFPADKSSVTGVTYEPWHFRYVGPVHAKIILETGLCLEEYLHELALL